MNEPMTQMLRNVLLFCLFGCAGALHASPIIDPTEENVRAALAAEAVEGIRLEKVTISGDKDVRVRLEGNSATNERLSAFMRRIETSEAFHQTELTLIQVDPDGGYHFDLQCKVRRPPASETTPAPAPATAPKATTPATPSPTRRKVFRCVIGSTETFQMTPCPAT